MAAIPLWQLPAQFRLALWRQVGYVPNSLQLEAHLRPYRIRQVAGGERGGKSYWLAMEMLTWLAAQPDGTFWIVGPDYELARAEFQYIIAASEQLGWIDYRYPISQPKMGGWSVHTINGSTLETKTSADVKKLASVAPDGIGMAEAAQQDYEAFLRCRGRVAQKRAPLILSGTFESSFGWYADLWQRWQTDNSDGGHSYSFPSWSNRTVYPGGRQDPEILALEVLLANEPGVFMERYGAIPCPPSTVVFREFSYADHVTFAAEYNQAYGPVQLWIDPGYANPYAVVVVQIHHGIVRVFDEIYERGLVGEKIIDMALSRPWAGKVSQIVMDVASKAHPATESQAELWERRFRRPVIMNPVSIEAGILRHHTFLYDPDRKDRAHPRGVPRLIHHPRVKCTIGEYGKYRRPADKDGHAVSEVPIDKDNHSLKGIAYGLVANFGEVNLSPQQAQLKIKYK